MNARRTDLLAVTRGFVRFGQVMLTVWMVVAAAIFIGLLNGAGKPLPAFTGTLATMDPEASMYALKVGVVGALVAGALLFPLLQELIRLIDSARIGDPFVPESGKRLRRIGWLLVAFNVCVSVTISLALSGSIRLPMTSFSGWLTVLLVFVLARIFETGSRMRAELQETV
jgi:Protein of unknown function (DUF2975)